MAKTYTFPMMVDDFKKLSRYDQMAAVTQAEKKGIPYNKAVVKTMLGALQSYPDSEKLTVTIPDNPRDGEYSKERLVGSPERMTQQGKAGISSKYDPTPQDRTITQEDYDYVKKQRKEGNYNTFGALDPSIYNRAIDVPESIKSEKKEAKSDPGKAVSDKPKPEDLDPPEEGAPDKVEPEAEDVQKPAGKKKGEDLPSKAEVDRPDADDVPSARVIPEDAGPAPDISQVSKALEELGRANPTMQKEPTEKTEQGFKVERLVDRVKDSIDAADLEDSPPADVPDVELEERADPPAASQQMAAKLPDAAADVGEPEMEDFGADIELEDSPSVSASDIEEFAEAVPNGMGYLKVAFKDFNRKAYNPDSVVDRRRMQFLMNFLKKAGFPQDPEERALVAKQAFQRLQEELTESSEAQSSRTRQAIDRE